MHLFSLSDKTGSLKRSRFFYWVLTLLFVSCISLKAQLDNASLFLNVEHDTVREHALYAKIQNLNFMKDNEYSGPIAEGYTLFGYQLNTQIGYKLSKNLSIEGGIFISKDFGRTDFFQVLPSFTMRYVKRDFKMAFGNIDGSLNHQLIEPLYNFERVISNRLESGAQFVINKKHFGIDAWIDWQYKETISSPEPERFITGGSFDVFKINNEKLEFKIPLQGLIRHTGGQQDTLHLGTRTYWNYAAGVVLKYKTGARLIKAIYTDVRYVANDYYHYHVGKTTYQNGTGLLANIGFKGLYDTDVMLSYWYGDNYNCETGGFLYSSHSSVPVYSYYSERYRDLLILRISKNFVLAKGTNLMVRIEPNYDIRNNWFETAFGFYISLDERLWLKN